MEDLRVYTMAELEAELKRLDVLLARKRHAPLQLTARRAAVIAELESRKAS